MLGFALLALITAQGHVVDAVTQQPVPDARVVLLREGQSYNFQTWSTPLKPNPASSDPVIAVMTNELGAFRFQVDSPVNFRLFVSKEGYVRQNEQSFSLTNDRSGISILLVPSASISGRVLDSETQQPVRGFAVVAYSYRKSSGGSVLGRAGDPGKTDEEGRYRVSGLGPGEYLLELSPPLGASFQKPKVVDDFDAEIRLTYTKSWYPGVPTEAQAAPVHVSSGSKVDGLDLNVARRRAAVLRGTLAKSDTESEINVMLILIQRQVQSVAFGVVARSKLKPGEGFEVENLAPGNYFVSATGSGPAEERTAAHRSFQLDERNLDLGELALLRGLDINGRVIVEDADPAPPLEGMVVSFQPPMRMSMGEESGKVNGSTGEFKLLNYQPETFIVRAGRAPKGFQAREIRYNGSPLVHGLLKLDPVAHQQQIEIILAPAASTIQATVTDGLRLLANATVLVVQDPVTPEVMGRLFPRQTSTEGRADIPNLLPGKYRIAAYPEGAEWANDPMLQQRLASAQEVSVAANASATIQIRAVMQ